MCGLFGWSFEVPPKNAHIMTAVLIANNDARGGHGWGYYDGVKVKKGTGLMAMNVSLNKMSKRMFLMAHTRFPSQGSICTENSHPFSTSKIIGAHNGIISNFKELNYLHGRNFLVDSQHIFAHLEEGKDLSELEGWGTIEYVLTRDPKVVYLSRFNNGELSIARIYIEKRPIGVLWSSDRSAISSAVKMAGMKATFYEVKEGTLYYVDHCKLWDDTTTIDIHPTRSLYDSFTWNKVKETDEDEIGPSWVRERIGQRSRGFDYIRYKCGCIDHAFVDESLRTCKRHQDMDVIDAEEDKGFDGVMITREEAMMK